MPDSRRHVFIVQLYLWILYVIVTIFWMYYITMVFSFRRDSKSVTPFVNILRKIPGNVNQPLQSEYDFNLILVSFMSAVIFYTGIVLPILHLRYDEGKLRTYDAVTHNIYLPETIISGMESLKRDNGFQTNGILIILLLGEIVYQSVADVVRSVHFVLPRHFAAVQFRRMNGEALGASMRDRSYLECQSGNCVGEPVLNSNVVDEKPYARTDAWYYFRIGLQRICAKGNRHGGIYNVHVAKRALGIVDDFEKQEKLLYAFASSGITQAVLGMSIKEYSDVSGADIYTRFAVLLAVFTISFSAGPLLKSCTFHKLKEDMNEYILEKGKRYPRDILQEDFVWLI